MFLALFLDLLTIIGLICLGVYLGLKTLKHLCSDIDHHNPPTFPGESVLFSFPPLMITARHSPRLRHDKDSSTTTLNPGPDPDRPFYGPYPEDDVNSSPTDNHGWNAWRTPPNVSYMLRPSFPTYNYNYQYRPSMSNGMNNNLPDRYRSLPNYPFDTKTILKPKCYGRYKEESRLMMPKLYSNYQCRSQLQTPTKPKEFSNKFSGNVSTPRILNWSPIRTLGIQPPPPAQIQPRLGFEINRQSPFSFGSVSSNTTALRQRNVYGLQDY